MTRNALLKLISQGEDSVLQFKLDVTNADSLAAEFVAMSNGKGGKILIGVADDGSLPGLSASDVRRLNQLISNAAKRLLPYRGLGSGITRALKDWQDITFLDDREGGLFTATVRRALPTKPEDDGTTERTTQKTTQKILSIVADQPTLNRKEIAELMGDITQDGVKYHLEKLKAAGKLRRIGPDKGGYGEVVNQ